MIDLRVKAVALVAVSLMVAACKKDPPADADAAAEAAAPVDAAPEAAAVEADAAADAEVDAAPAPTLAKTAVPVPKATATTKVDPPICVKARAAAKRGSPAAAGLEAQCKAAGGTL